MRHAKKTNANALNLVQYVSMKESEINQSINEGFPVVFVRRL